ncbi:MAG: cyanophycinase [bacterium]|nr:cyanophycinase [bacterium]
MTLFKFMKRKRKRKERGFTEVDHSTMEQQSIPDDEEIVEVLMSPDQAPSETDEIIDNKGFLVLIGGHEDKRGSKRILKHTISLNNAKKVVVIPTASWSYAAELGGRYSVAFRDLGVAEVNVLDIRYKDEADRPENLAKVKEADMVFFTGGDQVRLVDILKESRLMALVKKRYIEENITIAGTSAGAAAASNPMLYDGDDLGFEKGSVRCAEGFGLIERFAVDTHFNQRSRIARLAQFLASGNSKAGIGIDENTAFVVDRNKKCYVLGMGMVTVLTINGDHYTDYKDVDIDENFTLDGVRLSYLASGTRFDLEKVGVIASSVPVPKDDLSAQDIAHTVDTFAMGD